MRYETTLCTNDWHQCVRTRDAARLLGMPRIPSVLQAASSRGFLGRVGNRDRGLDIDRWRLR